MTSPYFHPAGTNLFYKYGNFCGPGIPVAEGQPTPEHIATVIRTPAVDWIDTACKAHDLCYLRFGVQRACDDVLNALLTINFGGETLEIRGQCASLAAEINQAVLLRTVVQNAPSDRLAAPVTAPVAAVGTAIYGGFRLLDGASNVALGVAGWPAEPGHCLADRTQVQSRIDSTKLYLASARLQFESGPDTRDPPVWRQYRDSSDFIRFLAGGW